MCLASYSVDGVGLDIVINGWSLKVITYLPPSAKIRNVWNFYPSPFFGVILSPKCLASYSVDGMGWTL